MVGRAVLRGPASAGDDDTHPVHEHLQAILSRFRKSVAPC